MPAKTIVLSDEDLASVQRLLSTLAVSVAEEATDGREIPPEQLLRIARATLNMRKKRAEYLHPAMLGEPAYDMLLALYVGKAEQVAVTATRLGELAGVAPSSALRWIEYLVAKELVDREPHPSHKRASILKLSSKGQAALEGVFRLMLDGLQEAAF